MVDTYTYIPPAISVGRGFSGVFAVARDSTNRHYLSRSSHTGLGAGLPSAKCVWTACERRRGCPATRGVACCARGNFSLIS